MFCTTIIPTVGRDSLSGAVCSVLDQELPGAEFEVIVVNDTGRPLAELPWQRSPQVRVVTTQRRERSVARNTGAALARGRFLHFLDDDDLLHPGALAAFQALAAGTDATWLYGSYRSVDNAGNLVEEFRPGVSGDIFALLMAGENIPLQASLFEAQGFFAAGAFDPLIKASEDLDMVRRFVIAGTVAYTPAVVASIRVGPEGSTTDLAVQAAKARWSREKLLRDPRALRRALASASTSYLRGRASRAYIASMLWNLRHDSLPIGIAHGLQGALLAGRHVFSGEFWRGMRAGLG